MSPDSPSMPAPPGGRALYPWAPRSPLRPPGRAGSVPPGVPPGMRPPGRAGMRRSPGLPPGLRPPGRAGSQAPCLRTPRPPLRPTGRRAGPCAGALSAPGGQAVWPRVSPATPFPGGSSARAPRGGHGARPAREFPREGRRASARSALRGHPGGHARTAPAGSARGGPGVVRGGCVPGHPGVSRAGGAGVGPGITRIGSGDVTI